MRAILIEELAVLILRDNSPVSQDCIEIKLLNLYSEHESVSLTIIKILNLASIAIKTGDGDKLELYSMMEKELVNKLLNIDKVITGFEKIRNFSSKELNRLRIISNDRLQAIRFLEDTNQETLKCALIELSSQIDQFSGKEKYSSVTQQVIPQFVDFNV